MRNPAILFCALSAALVTQVQAGSVTLPNTFQAGTRAVAAEVNANFAAIESAVDDNDARIAALESAVANLQATVGAQANTIADLQATVSAQASTITALQATATSQDAEIASLQSSSSSQAADIDSIKTSDAFALNSYLSVVSDSRGPLLRFHGANVQVVNGAGSTTTVNGLGNLIVGYDEVDTSGEFYCTTGTTSAGVPITDEPACTAEGALWTGSGFKSGSHNLVGGAENNYSSFGGAVLGRQNAINYHYATVSGGNVNNAAGQYASVSGGTLNVASGRSSSVTGGVSNTASGPDASSVSGGSANLASGNFSSVSGGNFNVSSGSSSSISGGRGCTVAGDREWDVGSTGPGCSPNVNQ
jgi:hypothetical protein